MIYDMSGARLNYKIVGGTSQPTSARENTIWLNTSAAITSHVFSATTPASPTEGMVWFKIGTSSNAPFNMLKKNTAMVYVVSCSQYMDGAWSAKGAKIYQGGEWKILANTILYLFDGTTDYTATSGGWEKWSGDGTITVEDGLINLSQSKGSGTTPKDGLFKHKTAVNASSYNTLTVNTGDISTYVDNRCQIRVCNAAQEELATVTLKKGTTEYTLDISEITGECYVVFRFRSFWDGTDHIATNMTISKVELSV